MPEKYNPFTDPNGPEKELGITNEDELREAKLEAGVVSEEEHKQRMLETGDPALIKDVKLREIKETISELYQELRDLEPGSSARKIAEAGRSVKRLENLCIHLENIRDNPNHIKVLIAATEKLKRKLGGRTRRTKNTGPLLDEIYKNNQERSQLERELTNSTKEAQEKLEIMGLPGSISVEDVEKMLQTAIHEDAERMNKARDLSEEIRKLKAELLLLENTN